MPSRPEWSWLGCGFLKVRPGVLHNRIAVFRRGTIDYRKFWERAQRRAGSAPCILQKWGLAEATERQATEQLAIVGG